MPYITEEIWQKIAPLAGTLAGTKGGDTIMRQPYPQPDTGNIDENAITEMEWVKDVIVGVRQIRSGMDIKPSKPLPVLLANASDVDRTRLERNQNTITFLARTESITVLGDGEEAPESATALVGDMKVLIPMAGLIDKDVEIARLSKEIEKKQQEVGRIEGKLSNPNFVERAPEAVVEKERAKIAEIQSALKNFEEQLERIKKM
jgi:valyl-tRNA synthetase